MMRKRCNSAIVEPAAVCCLQSRHVSYTRFTAAQHACCQQMRIRANIDVKPPVQAFVCRWPGTSPNCALWHLSAPHKRFSECFIDPSDESLSAIVKTAALSRCSMQI